MAHAPATKLTAKGRATRERIVRAASELMLEHGVARTTIEDIQEAAGVSTSQMYHYFADKGDLVAAVIDLQSDEVLGAQQLELERVDTIEALYRWPVSCRTPTRWHGPGWPARSPTGKA